MVKAREPRSRTKLVVDAMSMDNDDRILLWGVRLFSHPFFLPNIKNEAVAHTTAMTTKAELRGHK